MKILLANATQIRLVFAYNKRIIEQVKAIPGRMYDEKTKTWLVPVTRLQAVEELFPHAEYDPAVWSAEAEIMRASASQLLKALQRSGATFTLRDGAVQASGDCVSPLVADIIAERSVYFAALIRAGVNVAPSAPGSLPEQVEPTVQQAMLFESELLHPITRNRNQREDT